MIHNSPIDGQTCLGTSRYYIFAQRSACVIMPLKKINGVGLVKSGRRT